MYIYMYIYIYIYIYIYVYISTCNNAALAVEKQDHSSTKALRAVCLPPHTPSRLRERARRPHTLGIKSRVG